MQRFPSTLFDKRNHLKGILRYNSRTNFFFSVIHFFISFENTLFFAYLYTKTSKKLGHKEKGTIQCKQTWTVYGIENSNVSKILIENLSFLIIRIYEIPFESFSFQEMYDMCSSRDVCSPRSLYTFSIVFTSISIRQ